MARKIIHKIYDYKDSSGKLVFQVVRFQPKGFSQRRPFGDHSIWGLSEGWYRQNSSGDYVRINDAPLNKDTPCEDGVWFETIEPVLYRLPELRLAIENKKIIFIPEGEKDVENLVAQGVWATTCPMGAGKWEKHYTECLKGCSQAVVLVDKDDPGREHAEAVALDLFQQGIAVRVLELPDREGHVIKDVSDWLEAGGTGPELMKLVESTPLWTPSKHDDKVKAPHQEMSLSKMQDLVNLYGQPYYFNQKGLLTSINQSFWAGLHQTEHIQLYEPNEKAFYRYCPETGLYTEISIPVIKQEISARILEVSRKNDVPELERKRTNSTLLHVVAHLQGISERKEAFKKKDMFVHLANGVIVLKGQCADLVKFSPAFYSRNQSPLSFDSSAKCERFLNEFLYPAVSADDVIMLQKYAGLCLLGNNLIQRFLILDGKAGRGKSTMVKIIQSLIGMNNITQLRTNHLSERFELYRYLKKTLLHGIDVPGNFLSLKSAQVVKGLVGGDWFDAEQKGGTGSFPFQGNFCILITSNCRLHVHLDGDLGPWKRRLLIIPFNSDKAPKKIPDFDKILIQEEGSGILNWALQGLRDVFTDVQEVGDIRLTASQEEIIDSLLAESDSLRHFLRENVVRREHSELMATEIIQAYAEYCPQKGWNAKDITDVHNELEGLMLELFRTPRANSVKKGNSKDSRGYRNVGFKNSTDSLAWE